MTIIANRVTLPHAVQATHIHGRTGQEIETGTLDAGTVIAEIQAGFWHPVLDGERSYTFLVEDAPGSGCWDLWQTWVHPLRSGTKAQGN